MRSREQAIARVRAALSRYASEPYGDLRLNADRAAAIAVLAVMEDDPNPDCGHEWHGADGGPCPWCGWDSHPVAEQP